MGEVLFACPTLPHGAHNKGENGSFITVHSHKDENP